MKFLKYIKNVVVPVFAIILIVATGGFLSSCEEEETMDQVVLHSFGPSGIKHGETIKFIGMNLDKVSSIVLQPGVEISQFESKTSSLIELVVPKEAEAGKVTLKTPQGDIESKSPLSFEVPVSITSITEEAKPGTTITISGDLVNWIEMVTFEGGLEVTEFESESLTELVVPVPMEAQTGYLIFKTGGTEPLTFASEEELIVTLPTVTSIAPEAVRHTEDITISGTDLDLVTAIVFAGDLTVPAANFSSHTETEITLEVPAMTLKGALTLKQASPIDVVTSQELIIVLPIGTEVSPEPAVPGQDNVTITGTDLDLIADLTFPGTDPITSDNFVNHSATEIVVAVPEGANNGGITYTTIHGFASNLGVNLIIPGEGPPPLAITVYDEEFHYGANPGWSWGGTQDPANEEQFYSGSVSWKHVTVGNDGGAQIGELSVDASGQGSFVFSLFGGANTAGKQVAVILNGNWGNYNAVDVVPGEWTEYRLDFSMYPDVDFSNITQMTFKVEAATDAVLYIDRIGFDPAGPPPPAPHSVVFYDDAIADIFGAGGGWGSTTDFENTENIREGSNAIKVTFDGGWGGGAQFGTWGKDPVSTAGATSIVFYIFGGEGTADKSIQLLVKNADAAEFTVQAAIEAGAWNEVTIPLSELGDITEISEFFFQDTGWTGTVYIDYIGLR